MNAFFAALRANQPPNKASRIKGRFSGERQWSARSAIAKPSTEQAMLMVSVLDVTRVMSLISFGANTSVEEKAAVVY